MVPVLSYDKQPLAPCKERRAKALMKRGEAKPYWMKGIFCIRLVRKESEKDREYPQIALGIDPGSKREGYTVASEQGVILNITTNTPDWVKKHVETRRILRRNRRQRKTPYRKARWNRAALQKTGRIPPSTEARWLAKLNLTKFLLSIIPITVVNVEDIQAVSKKGQPKWNKSFSPLEVGKNWFYNEIQQLGISLIKTSGFDTYSYRKSRGFNKSSAKLDFKWEAHNSDSHCLVELALNKQQIFPYKGLWKIEFIQFHRRELHRQLPKKGGIRSLYGSTISMGIPRGTVVKYVNRLVYVGGTPYSKKIALHNILTGKRAFPYAVKSDLKILYKSSFRTQFICSTTEVWFSKSKTKIRNPFALPAKNRKAGKIDKKKEKRPKTSDLIKDHEKDHIS